MGRCEERPRQAALLRMASGSATESAAILDILKPRGLVVTESHAQGRLLLVVQMLTRMGGAPRDR